MSDKDFKPLGTLIHGIGASEHLDSSGEKISIRGLDISSLEKDGSFNWEHKNDQSSHIVGKVLKAKKIFSEEDCETPQQLYFWNKSQAPYLYIMGELFDGVGHRGAQEIAAMLKYDSLAKKQGRPGLNVINFSIEGSKLNKEGQEITRSLARKVTITTAACNKMAVAEILSPSSQPKQQDALDFAKSEESGVEILEKNAKLLKLPASTPSAQLKKLPHPFKTQEEHAAWKEKNKQLDIKERQKKAGVPSGKLLPFGSAAPQTTTTSSGKLFNPELSGKVDYYRRFAKALTAGSGLSAPSEKTGGEALAREDLVSSIEKISNYPKFLKFVSKKYPNMTKDEAQAMAKYLAARQMIRAEEALEKMAGLDKSKNVREQRKKIFGTDPNAPRLSEKRQLEHYSRTSGLKTIDPSYIGTGVPSTGHETKQTSHPHSFYYKVGGPTEDIVTGTASHKYTVEIPEDARIYDISTDPERFAKQIRQENNGAFNMDMMHQKMKDAGYHGFEMTQHPREDMRGVVGLYHSMPVSEEEQINKSTNPSPKYINVSQNWVSGIYNRKTNKFHNPVIDAGKHMPEHMNDLHALKEAGHIKGWTEHESPQKTWGEETYQVGPEGRLKFVTAHYDTSD